MKNIPLHLNFDAALRCKIDTSINVKVTMLFYSVMQNLNNT